MINVYKTPGGKRDGWLVTWALNQGPRCEILSNVTAEQLCHKTNKGKGSLMETQRVTTEVADRLA